jgi:hypothetical protein
MLIMKQLNFRQCAFLIMHKNELEKSYLIATIAIAGFLLLSVTASGIQSSHQVFAQGEPSMTNAEQANNAAASNNATTSPSGSTSGSAPSTTSSSPSSTITPSELPSSQGTSSGQPSDQATSASGQNEPPLNKNVVWQGFISSNATSNIPGHEKEHVATILGPRDDKAVYSGILTYQASKPVKVVVWNNVNPDNKTAIPKEFGSQEDMIKLGKNMVALTTLGKAEKSGSVPFTGNAIELVGGTGGGKNKDFTATYSVNVVGTQGKTVNNLESIAAAVKAANSTGSNTNSSG